MPTTDRIGELLLFLFAGTFGVLGFGWLDQRPAAFVPGEREATTLRVVTWNVGGRAAPTGQPMQDDWIPNIAETILKLSPDVVLLQEVASRGQLDDLLSALGGTWRGTVTARGDRRVGVLYDRGEIRLPSTFWRRGQTNVALVYESPDHPALAIVAVHADAYSAKRRNKELGRALDLLMSMRGAEARLFAGDLNLDLDLDKRRDLFSDNEHLDVETYNYITNQLFDAGVGRGSTAEPDRRLDYIFVNEKLGVAAAGPWKDRRVDTMDHDPVVADLRFVDD